MTKAITRKNKAAAKRADRGVPFDEMRRLMRVYGSVKCLRKRQSPSGEDTKVDSVKRKFYRWFPDLEERFLKDADGVYRPKAGHEFELNFREEMRSKDGEILAKKRAKCRKERHGKHAKPSPKSAEMTNDCAAVSPDVGDHPVVEENQEASGLVGTDITLNLDQGPMSSTAMVAADSEPVDKSFIAEEGIFDDVEEDFFGLPIQPVIPESPESSQLLLSCSSSSSGEPASNVSLDRSSSSSDSSLEEDPSMEEMFNRSMEECCEEILGSSSSSDENSCVSDYLFEMITS